MAEVGKRTRTTARAATRVAVEDDSAPWWARESIAAGGAVETAAIDGGGARIGCGAGG